MSQTPSVPPMGNKAMKLVLRSPAHGMVSKTVLLITFTGRKSGKTYTTPVSYSRHGDQLYIFTHADWWKNLLDNPSVTLHVRGQELGGLAEVVAEGKQAIAAGLTAHLRMVPSDARYYHVSFDQKDIPNPDEVAEAVKTVVMVRVRVC